MKSNDFSDTVLAFSARQPLAGVDTLEIYSVVGYIEVVPYDEPDVNMEVYLNNTNTLAKLNVGNEKHGNKIYCYIKKRNIFFTTLLIRAYIKIYVPRDFTSKVIVNGVSANAYVNGMCCNSLEVSVVSGNIMLDSCVAEHMSTHSVSGNTELTNIKSNRLAADAKSGNLTVNGLEFCNDQPQIADIDIDSVSGSVYLMVKDCYNKIDIHGISGKVEVALPSNYRATEKINTVSGKVVSKLAGSPYEGRKISDNNSIDINLVSGGITVYR